MQAKAIIVDDSKTVRFQVRRILEADTEYAFQVLEACDGAEALRLFCISSLEELPDVVLLDRNMPNMSGDECIRILKSDENWGRIPVLFLTAHGDIDEVVRGLSKLLADDYLPKPFDARELLARVKVLVRIKHAEDRNLALNRSLQEAIILQKKTFEELKQTEVALAKTQAVASMTQIFEKFVPKQFLSRIAKNGLEHIQVGTCQMEKLTILFSDIRSFTSLSEKMTAQDVFSFLNEYLALMQKPIEEQSGFIDKFIGDAIMALFDGLPESQATRAVNAAIGMQNHLLEYNEQRKKMGDFPILTGIGLHFGQVMLGTLGDEKRMDSTVIGDVVNLASRLEGLTKEYHASIIISEDVHRLLEINNFLLRKLDYVVVKGREKPIIIYEVLDSAPEATKALKASLLPTYHAGLEYYLTRQWKKGLQAFRHCLEQDPHDHMSGQFVFRCSHFQETPPPLDWDGSFHMLTK